MFHGKKQKMNQPTRDLLWLAIALTWGHVTEAASPQPIRNTIFKRLPVDDVMWRDDVLWQRPAWSRVECGLTCLRDARCVLYSVSPGTGGAAGTCRTHSKRLPPAARREVVSGARTFSPVTTVRSRPAGVLLGMTLVYLFWGANLFQRRGDFDLLLRCRDIESNPGPNPDQGSSGSTGSMRQTRPSSSHPSRSAKEPSLADVMATIQDMNTGVNIEP
ncbi:uncharacterized protein LOC143289336 [Babylonia areolata]|uniref:uncharacterized protein LOC143289336 n=1 Tax=Babylonia areolata TaxID=304850 RepID=UPI003FD38793